ncbi:MAG TPA: prepilin-type N-terminal cleavage/methylation domain-containing protein, partial [Planctomycetota bacterium]|nr:prepilin-type N-terminal cleavage/methylation domain-containing protein [Planctomycetota bacterium]
MRPRQAFTLFEVAISLAIMGFAVVSVLMVFPLGLKEQQQARARLLAATKAMELIEYFSGKSTSERMAEFETPEPWDTRPFCYTNTRWDLESRLARFDSGIRPLPIDIARRLDSDGDEIQTLLGEGAYLYYADAAMIPGVDIRLRNPSPPVESNKVVFAVSGYAQNNAVPVLPWKAWPYRAAYPSPPLSATFGGSRFLPQVDVTVPITKQNGATTYVSQAILMEGWSGLGCDPALASARDPLITDVFRKAQDYTETVNPLVNPTSFNPDSSPPQMMSLKTKRTALAEACLAFAQDAFTRAGISPDYQSYIVAAGITDFHLLGTQWDQAFRTRCVTAQTLSGNPDTTLEIKRSQIGLEVQAWRFLAMAAATYYVRREADPEPDLSMEMMGTIPISLDRLRYYHDRCVNAAMLYAASFPYDWTAPRPQARAIMMDQPLFEFDL